MSLAVAKSVITVT